MADFRKWIIALSASAVFAGLACAQSGQTSFGCTATAAETPQIRSEGLTEPVGDIVLNCTGGLPLAQGSLIPTANITVYLNSTVTSRLLGNGSVSSASEALLLIDDPQSSQAAGATYGQQQAQIFCGSSNPGVGAGPGQNSSGGNCAEWIGNSTTGGTGVPVASNPVSGNPPTFNPDGLAPGPNVFQGVVSGSSVTFFGVPIQPPATQLYGRTYRITNIRINANGIGAGSLTPATANIAVTGTAAMPISNSLLTVGYISTSMTASVRDSGAGGTNTPLSYSPLLQCVTYPDDGSSKDPYPLETLRFSELQGSAFKYRGTTAQNVPGQIYTNTESDFTFTNLTHSNSSTGVTYTAGYADWGTRLKAVFTNIPSGVSLYVSTVNMMPTGSYADLNPQTFGSQTYASLIGGETLLDTQGNNGTNQPVNFLPLVSQTGTETLSDLGGTSAVPFAPIVSSGGTGSAVWEVVSSDQNVLENFDFEVFMVVNPSLPGTPPAPSTMTVNLSYAPIPTQGAFSASSGGAASSSLGIPRFADTSSSKTALTFVICQTALLYPYVINVAGFDTGLSIANTSSDPFSTAPQTGYCQIYWYGTAEPATNPGYLGSAGYQTTIPTSSQVIQSGTIQSWGASVVAPGFEGYVIAVCNFQYAHGFAFVSDLGARNLAMGYLAEVLGDVTGDWRNVPPAEGNIQ